MNCWPLMTAAVKAGESVILSVRSYPPETTIEESGYFSLCEGLNGKIYVGTAAYGRNSYLVEFDPASEQMRIVLDTHKLVGLPLEATGYAAQAKLHTRNFVGPSGKIATVRPSFRSESIALNPSIPPSFGEPRRVTYPRRSTTLAIISPSL